MKRYLAAKPLSRGKAQTYFAINQLATPGLGSLLGRRFVSGACQLLLAIAGFVLLMVWMCEFFYARTLQAADETVTWKPAGWLGAWGLILFGAGWLWSLFTSVSMLRHIEPDPEPPPVIVEDPPQDRDQTGR